MANVLGSLLVELGVNTAAFSTGLDKATYQTKAFGRDIESSFRQAANSISTVTVAFGALGPAGAAVSEVLLKMGQAVGSTTAKFASLNPTFGVFAGAAAGVAAGAAAAAGALIGMAVETAEVNDKLFHQAEIAGTSFESFQRLAAGAKMYEISSQTLSMTLTRMSRQILTASESANYSQTSFGRLGIQVKDAGGHLKDTETIFYEIMDKLSNMRNETERNALAMQMLGRSGMQLIPALAEGSARFREFGEFAQRVGAVLTDDAGRGAHEFSVEMEKVGIITEGAKNQLSLGIIPALTRLIDAYAAASHGGELFAALGATIGDGLRQGATVGVAAYEALYTAAVLASKGAYEFDKAVADLDLAGWTSKANKAVADQASTAISRLDKDLSDLQKKDKEFFDSLNKPVTAPTGAEKTGASPNLNPRKTGIGKDMADTVGDFIDKLSLATNEQLRLASAIDLSAGALALLKAQADAEKAVAEKRLELQGKLDALQKEKGELIKANEPEKADLLNKSIGEVEKQLKKLTASAGQIGAAFASTAVLTSLNEMAKSIVNTTASLTEQISEQERLAAVQDESPADQVFAKADEKIRAETLSLAKARAEYELLSKVSGVKPEIIAAAAAQVDSLSKRVDELRVRFETLGVVTALNEVNSTIIKMTSSLDDQILEQERLAAIQSRGAAEQVFEKADEKIRAETVSLEQARREYELLSKTPGVDPAALDAAKKSVDELTYKLEQLRAGFEALGVLTALNEANASVQRTTASIAEQLDETQRLNAARLTSAAALAAAQADEKIRSETIELQKAREEYERLSKTPGIDPAALETAKSSVVALEDEIKQLREEYAQLAASDPEYWQKLQQQVAEAQIKFGTITQALHGFISELELQGANTQMKVFNQLKQGIDGAEDSLARFIVTGKGGFIAVLKEMEISLIKLGLQFLVAAAMKRIFGNMGQGSQTAAIIQSQVARQAAIGQAAAEAATSAAWGGPAAAVAAAAITEASLQAITALASGGPVVPGNMYLVGEKHPEIFVAGSAGHVYPTLSDVPGLGAGGGALSALPRPADSASTFSRAATAASPVERASDSGASPAAPPINIGISHSVSAIDADSFRGTLVKHSDILADAIIGHLRRLNMPGLS